MTIFDAVGLSGFALLIYSLRIIGKDLAARRLNYRVNKFRNKQTK